MLSKSVHIDLSKSLSKNVNIGQDTIVGSIYEESLCISDR